MSSLRQCLFESYSENHLSYFSASDQPASLFTGVRHRLMIFVNRRTGNQLTTTTRFLKWFTAERKHLFPCILQNHRISGVPPASKVSSKIEEEVLKKVLKKPLASGFRRKRGKEETTIYYHNAPVHWGKIFDFVPYYRVGEAQPTISSHVKCLNYKSRSAARVMLAFLNSSLFYWWNWHFTNCRDLSINDIDSARIDVDAFEGLLLKNLEELTSKLMLDMKANSKIYKRVSNGVLTQFDSFYPAKSKYIIDEIDKALAPHYGFTQEELDFIINYDIKYRMGMGGSSKED